MHNYAGWSARPFDRTWDRLINRKAETCCSPRTYLYGRRLESGQGDGYTDLRVMRAEELAATHLASLLFRRGRGQKG